jgi:peptidyl-Asp metalloendopeptidase
MRPVSFALFIAFVLPACSADWDPQRGRAQRLQAPSATTGVATLGATATKAPSAGVASMPDRGALLGYVPGSAPVQGGAFTRYAIELSEEHAFRAAHAGAEIVIPLPQGRTARFAFERSEETPDGNWSWIGRSTDGLDAVITFGERAVFGNIAQAGAEPLRLTTSAGRAWLVVADSRKLLDGNHRRKGPRRDYFLPPARLSALADAKSTNQGATAEDPNAKANVVVDVVVGFSNGFAASLGGASQANTRVANLVAISNQAYANSLIGHRIRLVRALAVNYADTNSNSAAIEALTGYSCTSTSCTPISVPAALKPLRDAREAHGGDLVSLLRDFRVPENENCGYAWILGGGGSGINAGDAPFGYSVVSHGEDFDESDGKTYFCDEDTFAHELGHNMGQQHNTEDSGGDSGAHPYSYGYREASGNGFYTVMAYRLPDSDQFGISYFANPAVTFSGRATGIANSSDNARSMTATMPIIATFRASIGNLRRRPDLFGIRRITASGNLEVHALAAANSYTQFRLQAQSGFSTPTGAGYDWAFRLGQFDGDGIDDLYIIRKMGLSGRTVVYVMGGANRFATYLLASTSALAATGSDNAWVFDLGDYNADGRLDLYAIKRVAGSGKTEVHVLDGANGFQTFLLHAATALGSTGNDLGWKFEVGHFNNDGALDVYAIKRNAGSGRTEVHVLSGATRFQTFLLHRATALGNTGLLDDWDFKLGDYDEDGVLDLYAIKKQGTSKTEVHVLDGADQFRSFSTHLATALGKTGSNGAWQFDLGGP